MVNIVQYSLFFCYDSVYLYNLGLYLAYIFYILYCSRAGFQEAASFLALLIC